MPKMECRSVRLPNQPASPPSQSPQAADVRAAGRWRSLSSSWCEAGSEGETDDEGQSPGRGLDPTSTSGSRNVDTVRAEDRTEVFGHGAPIFAALLQEVLRERARDPRCGGVVCGKRRISLPVIDQWSDRLARAMVRKGIQPGDRVLVILGNCVESIVAAFAVWKARAILVSETPSIRPSQLHHRIDDARPAALLVERGAWQQLRDASEIPSNWKAVFVKNTLPAERASAGAPVEPLEAILNGFHDTALELPSGASADDVVSISYTSGSTGPPKGVMHTHDSWLAAAEYTARFHKLSPRDSMVVSLPLHHAYAFRQMLAYLWAGGTLVLAGDLYEGLQLLKRERPTSVLLVPAACNLLLDHFRPILTEAREFLRYVEIGSAALAPGRLAELRQLLPETEFHFPYGLTEVRVAFLEAGSEGRLNRIAVVFPGLELRVVGASAGGGDRSRTGEIVVRGRGLMKDYWSEAAGPHGSVPAEGFRTGDLARVDADGATELIGRCDDMLKIGGRKVNPHEVEAVLSGLPGVLEAAVVAIPDPRGVLEAVLHAFVVPRAGSSAGEVELLESCRGYLEPYQIPARIHVCDSLPRTAVGKVVRRSLAADAIAQ